MRRAKFPLLPLPTLTYGNWLTTLLAATALFLSLSPFAFRSTRALRLAAIPLALVFGVLNAFLHMLSSICLHRSAPGAYTSPVLLAAAALLMAAARKCDPVASSRPTS